MRLRLAFIPLYMAALTAMPLSFPIAARSDVAAAPAVVPSATKVLILPTLDTTADRPEMQQTHIVTSDHRLAYEFLIRGFAVQAPDVAQRAARTADIDLTAPDERTRKNLKIMGHAAGATWVVALTVMDVSEVRSGSFLSGGGRRAKSKVEIRVWDVAADTYITNKFYEATKSTKRFLGNIGTTGLFRQAIDTTVQRSVQDILAPYKINQHLQEQFAETDVVKGESDADLASGNVSSSGPILTSGTPVTVVLQSQLRSDTVRDNDPVTFHVGSDIYSTDGSHTRLIAKDAIAMGRIIVGKRRGYAGQQGTLQFTCDYAMAVSGKRVYLRQDKIKSAGHSNETGAIALTAAVGGAGLLLSGTDAKFDAGTPFTLYVDQDTAITPEAAPAVQTVASAPPPAAPSANPKTLFTMKDGTQIVGELSDTDGTTYTVTTATGTQSLSVADVASMHALGVAPAAPTVAATPPALTPAAPATAAAPVLPAAAPVPPVAASAPPPSVAAAPLAPAPGLPVIKTFPQKARIELTNGNSYFGNITAFDGSAYTMVTHNETMTLYASSIKTLELQQ